VNLKKKSAGEDIQDGDLEAQGATAKTRKFAKNPPTLFSLLKPKKYSEPVRQQTGVTKGQDHEISCGMADNAVACGVGRRPLHFDS
jgi:hypothetical protein